MKLNCFTNHLSRKIGGWYKLQRPMFGLHITVVHSSEFRNVDTQLWGKVYSEREINVEYNLTELAKIGSSGQSLTGSDILQEIRKSFDLNPAYKFHITVAREYDNLKLKDTKF